MTTTLRWEDGAVVFLDQTLLPHREVEVRCREVAQLAEAVKALRIRGAPALGIAAAFGVWAASAVPNVTTSPMHNMTTTLARNRNLFTVSPPISSCVGLSRKTQEMN